MFSKCVQSTLAPPGIKRMCLCITFSPCLLFEQRGGLCLCHHEIWIKGKRPRGCSKTGIATPSFHLMGIIWFAFEKLHPPQSRESQKETREGQELLLGRQQSSVHTLGLLIYMNISGIITEIRILIKQTKTNLKHNIIPFFSD